MQEVDQQVQTAKEGAVLFLQARGRGVRGAVGEGHRDGAHDGQHEGHGHGWQPVQQGGVG